MFPFTTHVRTLGIDVGVFTEVEAIVGPSATVVYVAFVACERATFGPSRPWRTSACARDRI